MASHPAVQTIVFDLGRTLIPFSFAPLRVRLQEREAEARALFIPFETGRISPLEFRRRLGLLAGVAPGEFDSWWNSIFESRWLIPPAALAALRRQRRLGLLSNTNPIHWDFLHRRFPELLDFDFHVLSFEVGAVKPEDAIFAAVERLAQCPPQAIFYTDDIAGYVAAARARGWQAALFTSPADCARALAAADPSLAIA